MASLKASIFSGTGHNLRGAPEPSQAISATVCCPQRPVSTNKDHSLDIGGHFQSVERAFFLGPLYTLVKGVGVSGVLRWKGVH